MREKGEGVWEPPTAHFSGPDDVTYPTLAVTDVAVLTVVSIAMEGLLLKATYTQSHALVCVIHPCHVQLHDSCLCCCKVVFKDSQLELVVQSVLF